MKVNLLPGLKLIRLQWASKHGLPGKVQLITPTGFTLLRMGLLKSMMDLLKLQTTDRLLKNSQENFWFSLNLMLQVFQAVVCEIPSKQEDTQHGMFHRLYL